MLDLSSSLRLLPFFAPPGRYYISEVPLDLAVPFSASEVSFPLFSLSDGLIVSGKNDTVWASS